MPCCCVMKLIIYIVYERNLKNRNSFDYNSNTNQFLSYIGNEYICMIKKLDCKLSQYYI